MSSAQTTTGLGIGAVLPLVEAAVLHDGRVLRLAWTTLDAPASHGLPDWEPGAIEGLAVTLSGGRAALAPMGVAVSCDFNMDPPGWYSTTAGGAEGPQVLADGNYYVRVAFVEDATGAEVSVSRLGGAWGSSGTPTWGHRIVAAAPSTQTARVIFPRPVPAGHTARIYLSETSGSLSTCRLLVSGIPAGTTSHLITSATFEDATRSPRAIRTWESRWLIRAGAEVVTFGEAGLAVTVPAGLYRDRFGNASGPATAFPVANNSLVDLDGFTTDSFLRGAGAKDYHVAGPTWGSDSGDGSLAAPFATGAFALSRPDAAGNGSRIRFLRGVTHVLPGVGEVPSGASWSTPTVVEGYWADHGQGGVDPGGRATIVDQAGRGAFRLTSSGYQDARTEFIVLRGLDVRSSPTPTNALFFWYRAGSIVLDDCLFAGGNTNVSFEPPAAYQLDEVTLLRCILRDGFSASGSHNQGLYAQRVRRPLVSQCFLDHNGWVGSAADGRTIFDHNVYVQFGTGHLTFWGTRSSRGGSHGLQFRGGGWAAYNLFDRNAVGSLADRDGGSQAWNVYIDGEDIDAANPRGGGPTIQSTTEQSATSMGVEYNLILDPVGAGAYTAEINWFDTYYPAGFPLPPVNGVFRHNLAKDHGRYKFTSPMSGAYRQYNNIFSAAPDQAIFQQTPTKPTGVQTWEWYDSDRNVLHGGTPGVECRSATGPISLDAWKTLTGGTETASITTTPAYANGAYGLDALAVASGFVDEAAHRAAMRDRSAGAWGPAYDASAFYNAFRAARAPTNLVASGPGPLDYYGPVDYGVAPAPGPTSATLAGPATATVGVPIALTLSLDAPAVAAVTFAMAVSGAAGAFSTAAPSIATGSTSTTLTFTAAAAGTATITADDAGLIGPPSLVVTVAAAPAPGATRGVVVALAGGRSVAVAFA